MYYLNIEEKINTLVKPLFYRPAQLRGLAFLGMLLLALTLLGGMIWRNLHRFETVLSYVNYSHRIQNVSVSLQQSLIEYLTEVPTVSPSAALAKTLADMDILIADPRYLSADTRTSLDTVRNLLADVGTLGKIEKNTRLITALKVMSETLDKETLQRENLLQDISSDTQAELNVALFILAWILLVALLFLHFRILHPLHDLKQLLQRLVEEDYSPITTNHLDPLLLPVFNSYNEMVNHLAELEEAKRLHAQSLQQEVRLATQALLEQQYSLARAERLAAIGEVAAELAHEIRNPLAGIQMAFTNFRRETDNPDQLERLDLINTELKRLTSMLNEMLDNSRHTPEPATNFDVVTLIRDLLALTRYQIDESICLQLEATGPLQVHLPESGLRQALLNLLLNAADAIEENTGWIEVQVREAHELHINVSDNGTGFSEDMLEHGIRPFRTSRQRGTGLGLAMVQRFVKDMGGTITLSNLIPHGARVSIVLPNVYSTGDIL
jgi:two-component system, NtrC family, sensor kinase